MSVAALLGKLRIDAEMHTARMEKGMANVNRSVDRMSSKLIGLQNIALGVAGAAGFGALVSGMIDVTNKAIGWEAALKVATGSTEGAKTEMAFLRKESDRLGISLTAASTEYGKLAASAVGTDLAMQDVRDIFTATMEASRVFNLSMDDAQGAMRALSQMISKGTVSMEEMRQQYAERLPGAMQAAARAMNMTVEEFSKAVSQGDILSSDLLPKLAIEMRALVADSVALAEQSPAATFQRMANAIVKLGQAIGQSGIVDAFQWLAEKATGIIDSLTIAISAFTKEADAASEAVSGVGKEIKAVSNQSQMAELTAQIGHLMKARRKIIDEVTDNDKQAAALAEIDAEIKKLADSITGLNTSIREGENAFPGFSEEAEGQIDAFIKDVMRGTASVKEQLLPALKATKPAGKIFEGVSETITIQVRDMGDVLKDTTEATYRQALAFDATAKAGQAASSAIGDIGKLLAGFGLSFNLGGNVNAGFGALGNLPQIFNALVSPAGLATAGIAGGAALGGTGGQILGGIAGGGLGFLGAGALTTSLLAAGPPTAMIASMLPFLGPIGLLAGAGLGFTAAGGDIGRLFGFGDRQKNPAVSLGTYAPGTFAGPGGAIGQRSVFENTPFGQFMIGGREGQARTQEMFDIARTVREMDEVVAGLLNAEEIARGSRAVIGIGENTSAGAFDGARSVWWRFRRLFDVLDNDLEALWDAFQPTADTLSTFINSLEQLSALGDDARQLATGFDMAEESFGLLVGMLKSFEDFSTTTFADAMDLVDALSRTPAQEFASAAVELEKLMVSFDGSALATENLSAALVEFGRTEIALAADLKRAREATSAGIASTAQRVRFLSMTPEEIWDESRTGANQLLADIRGGQFADPTAIQGAADRALALFNQGFGALSDEQQLAQQQDALEFLNALDEASKDAFASVESRLEQIHSNMAETVVNMMERAANAQIDAARVSSAAIVNASNQSSRGGTGNAAANYYTEVNA